MPKIYEYFGFIFLFYANDHEPIHVHVQYAEYESKVTFVYDNGALISLEFANVTGRQPIPGHKHQDIINFLKVYHNHIVTKWLQFYVYKQKVQSEKITKKVEP